jgi:hypothetical protein
VKFEEILLIFAIVGIVLGGLLLVNSYP